MLIKGLCDYYDILKEKGEVLPYGYSVVSVKYKISLTEGGKIDEIIPCHTEATGSGDKAKIKYLPKDMVMPKRTEKPGIDANFIEHRPVYIFGLNFQDGEFSPDDKTGKARKSHEDFKEKNLEFIEGIDSPVVNAYRNFIVSWNPEEESDNGFLTDLGKNYSGSGFAFFLSGEPDKLLHEDEKVKERWESRSPEKEDGEVTSQCAVTGKKESIARIHNKIKGVYGGLATGSVLIGFNNSSENSYGNEQSYNSNISNEVMEKYTEALNYILRTRERHSHKIMLDDITVIFWAMSKDEGYEDVITAMLMAEPDKLNGDRTEERLESLLKRSASLLITEEDIKGILEGMDENTDFYIAGLKPNSSRLSIKFILKKRYADIIMNIARFQGEVQVREPLKLLPFYRIKKELVSPKSTSEKVNPDLLTKLFESIMYGNKYPAALLETLTRRVKTDKYVNDTRAGLIKAYLNRNEKEEIKMGLNCENRQQSYLCGRLFAVLERIQLQALGDINTTIKDKYFASAAAKPAVIFPKLLKLSQAHIKKLPNEGSKIYYSKLLGQIMNEIEGSFPVTLPLVEQGSFIIGYYQQNQMFFQKREAQEEQ